MSGEVYDVVIIGGGYTGISAARELHALGIHNFKLLEAYEDHLGGRAYSYDPGPAGSPVRYDHGAEYVGDLQNEIMQLIKDELPASALVNGANLRHPYPYQVMMLDGTRHRFRLDQSLFGITGIPPDLGLGAVLGIVGLLAELTLIEIQIDVLEPWNVPPHLAALDQISVWDWLNQKDWLTASVKDLVRISIEALLSVEPSEISVYYLLWYTACNNGLVTEVNDDAGGPQQYWLLGGMDQLADKFAKPVKDKIVQGVFTKKIDLSGDTVKVETTKGDFTAKKVLVAMSPNTAGKIEYVPAPSADRRALWDMPMGRTLKCQIFYKSSWWHDNQYNGYCGGANYPVLWVMDNSPPPGVDDDKHVLMTFTIGTQLDALGENPSYEEIVTHVTGTLRDLFQDDRALAGSPEYVNLVAHQWRKNAPSSKQSFIGGGPNSVFSIGGLTGPAGKMLNEHWDDKVFFASSENAKSLEPFAKYRTWNLLNDDNVPKYTDDGILLPNPVAPFRTNYSDWRQSLGYMDGAIVSGRYVAHELAKSLGVPNKLPAKVIAASGVGPLGSLAGVPGEAEVVSIFERMKSSIDALGEGDLAAWRESSSSPGGLSGWLSHAFIGAVAGEGTDPVERLGKIRDFAVAAIPHVEDTKKPVAHSAPLARAKSLLDEANALLKKKLGL